MAPVYNIIDKSKANIKQRKRAKLKWKEYEKQYERKQSQGEIVS